MDRLLLIRADASLKIGAGHIMRCLALAEDWSRRGGNVLFSTHQIPSALQTRLQKSNFHLLPLSDAQYLDPLALTQIASDHHAEWILLDGYHFSSAYQKSIKDAGLNLLVFDDFAHAQQYHADFVINPSLEASSSLYRDRSLSTCLLLGPLFYPLRLEFHRITPPAPSENVKSILVTLGGGDHSITLQKIISGLTQSSHASSLKVTVLSSLREAQHDSLLALAQGTSMRLQLLPLLDDLAPILSNTDLAICGGGGTAWELAFLGIPALVVILASNQEQNVRGFSHVGSVRSLGHAESLQPQAVTSAVDELILNFSARQAMSQAGKSLCDGRGTTRIWLHLSEDLLNLRPATSADAQLLHDWRNEPATRAASFEAELVPWEKHLQWFASRLADPRTTIWIVEHAGQPVGQVRFESENNEAVISISVAPQARGRGFGLLIIWTACRRFLLENPWAQVTAFIKLSNIPSMTAFRNAGFRFVRQEIVRGEPTAIMQLSSRDIFHEL